MTEPDVYHPNRTIAVDTMFWQHHSIFAGTQEQLDELRAEADRRAGLRYRDQLLAAVRPTAAPRPSVFAEHHPANSRLTPVLHVGFLPLLWKITTCQCGDRWPCNSIKQHLRRRLGWTADLTEHLKSITKRLPKPAGRLKCLRRKLAQGRRRSLSRIMSRSAGL
ncbi:MAG: hypothetical protein ACRD0P_11945 [Stackebrandtia sp.]